MYHISGKKQAWISELQHHRRTWYQYKVPEWLATLVILHWPKQRTIYWRDQDLFSFSGFKDLFLCPGLSSKVIGEPDLLEIRQLKTTRHFFWLEEVTQELSHTGVHQGSRSKAKEKAW